MPKEWITARYESHKGENIARRQKELRIQNAVSSAPALFQRLKAEMINDIKDYNAIFGHSSADEPCRAIFQDLGTRGFSVAVQQASVTVTMQEGTTIICAAYSGTNIKEAECVQAMCNDEGTPGYWYKGEEALTEERVSQLFLEPILCG